MSSPVIILIFFVTIVPPVLAYSNIVLPLQRQHDHSMEHLMRQDQLRHTVLFNATACFPVDGSFEMNMYLTTVHMGTPAEESRVVIDSGSDDIWISCIPCSECPLFNSTLDPLNFFNPARSSTVSYLPCEDKLCPACSKDNQCTYMDTYGDSSGASGVFLKDTLHFDAIMLGSVQTNSSAPVVFGCTTHRYGGLRYVGIDGILGFGRGDRSVISQLSAMGRTPKVFSHCFHGYGGGSLVIGQAVDPGINYVPLLKSKTHYNLNMKSISVNGQVLPIHHSAFSISKGRGTYIDSGTTLAYLVDEAYQALANAVNTAVAEFVTPVIINNSYCYQGFNRTLYNVFPDIRLNFEGDAVFRLKPEEYIVDLSSDAGVPLPCLGFQKSFSKSNILGVLVLRDKIVVYDVARGLIGWNAYYNCSLPVHATLVASKSNFLVPKMSSTLLPLIVVLPLMMQ